MKLASILIKIEHNKILKTFIISIILLLSTNTILFADRMRPLPPPNPTLTNTSCGFVKIDYPLSLMMPIFPPTKWEDDVRYYYQFSPGGTSTAYPVIAHPSNNGRTTGVLMKQSGKVYVRAMQLDNYTPLDYGNWGVPIEVVITINNPCIKPPSYIIRGEETFAGASGFRADLASTGGTEIRWYDEPFEGGGTLLHTGESYIPPANIDLSNLYVCAFNTNTGIESARILVGKLLYNMTIENVILKSNVKNESDLLLLDPTEISKTKVYYDGMGRPLQKVEVAASPLQNDIVMFMKYDSLGRQKKQYLPYSINTHNIYRKDALSEQAAFYIAGNLNIPVTNFPFSETKYELHSRGRAVQQSNPGESWNTASGHTIKQKYRFNTTNEIRKYVLNGSFYNGSTYYSANILYVQEMIDENGNQSKEITDILGRKIATANYISGEWLYTYYVYDSFGRVIHIIQPMGVSSGTQLTEAIMEKYVFSYAYDSRGNVISKIIPGKDIEYFVYNNKDQLVLSQDGYVRSNKGNSFWKFFKYDALGRQVYTGICNISDYINVDALRTKVVLETILDEQKINAGYGYTNRTYPVITENDITNLTFYDTYSSYPVATNVSNVSTFNIHVNGKVTRTCNRLIDENGALDVSKWYNQYLYYDDKYRVVKTIEENVSIVETTVNTYDFVGSILSTTKTQLNTAQTPNTSISVNKFFSYDHRNRLLSISETINGAASQVIVNNIYDELGKLEKKNFNIVNGKPLYATSNEYNIRNWQTLSDSYWIETVNNCDEVTMFDPSELLVTINAGDDDRDVYMGMTEDQHITWANYTAEEYVNALENYGFTDDHFAAARYTNMSIEGESNKEVFKNQVKHILEGYISQTYSTNLNETPIEQVNEYLGDKISAINQSNILPVITYTNCYDVETRNNLFKQEMRYETITGRTTAPAQYNGNISSITWKTSNMAENEYGHKYDKLNRLVESDYAVKSGSTWTNPTNYDVNGISYDANGNLLSMTQYGKLNTTNTYNKIDGLTYTYDGNRLLAVNDSEPISTARGDFEDRNTSNDDYTYDANGNLIEDKNKGILITYNYLNMPCKITFANGNTIFYIYDTNGNKKRMYTTTQISPTAPVTQLRTDYVNGFVYQNNELDFFANETGRVLKVSGGFERQYVISDHLGNARISVKPNANNQPEILQYDSYYPFGLEMGGMSFVSSLENKYKYNGKEKQTAHNLGWYDYGARFYDPQIGRWHVVDPLAEIMVQWSVYNYVFNNPVMLVDPDGRNPDVYIDGPDADKAVEALNESTSLKISRNAETGQLSAEGNASNPAEAKLLEAINDVCVDVHLITTQSPTYLDSRENTISPLIPGGYLGSKFVGEKVIGAQIINMESTLNYSKISGEKIGQIVTHEINEAYFGAVNSPGSTYKDSYNNSHNSASELDNYKGGISINTDTKSDPNNFIMQGRKHETDSWQNIISYPKKL